MKRIKFYDTSSLLKITDEELLDDIAISSITLEELENIKTSSRKDAETKRAARHLLHLLDQHIGEYTVQIFQDKFIKPIEKKNLSITNDTKILSCAIELSKKYDITFITNDLALKHIALLFFDKVNSVEEKEDEYCGFKEITLSGIELAYLYQFSNVNQLGLLTNEYAIIKNEDGDIIDKVCWTGSEYRPIKTKPIQSKWFGKVSPFQGDIYQILAIDSLHNNQLTVLRGKSGTGKSYLGLTYLFSLLEKQEIDKIYILCNPVATKDAARLGFYPGEKDIKLLDSQIGNFLFGKFGDRLSVEKLINEGKIVLIPTSDCRGMDISNGCGIYITEAQNTSVSMMKLMVQRIGENTKCVIEGDDLTQVDLESYENENNGLRRLSQVFRGQPYYGEIKLKNCYRSQIADWAEKM